MQCHCGEEVKQSGNFVKCGTPVDYANGVTGCGYYYTKEEAKAIREAIPEGTPVSAFPLCSGHELICRVGVSKGEWNQGRVYFTCDVRAPNKKCDTFVWAEKPKPRKKPAKETPIWDPQSWKKTSSLDTAEEEEPISKKKMKK